MNKYSKSEREMMENGWREDQDFDAMMDEECRKTMMEDTVTLANIWKKEGDKEELVQALRDFYKGLKTAKYPAEFSTSFNGKKINIDTLIGSLMNRGITPKTR